MPFPLSGDVTRKVAKFSTGFFAAVVNRELKAVCLKSRVVQDKPDAIAPYDLPGGGVWDARLRGPETVLPERMRHWLGVDLKQIGPQVGQLVPGEFGPQDAGTIDYALVHLVEREDVVGEMIADGKSTRVFGFYDVTSIQTIPLLGPDNAPGRMAEMIFAALSCVQQPIFHGQVEHAPTELLQGVVKVSGKIGQSLDGMHYVEFFRVGFVRIWKRIVPKIQGGFVVGYE